MFQRVAKTNAKTQFERPNMYIKPQLKLYNSYNKSCFQSAYLGENVINLLKQKVTQNVTISFGCQILKKQKHNDIQKGAKLAKNRPIWSP